MKRVDDAQEAVHQAVDVAFSLADIIGGFFSDSDRTSSVRNRYKICSARNDDTGVSLVYDPSSGNQPLLLCDAAGGATVSVSSPVPLIASQRQSTPTAGQHFGLTYYVPPSTEVPLTIQNMTRGVFTATLLPDSDPGYDVPLAAVTVHDFLTHTSQITPDLSLEANANGIILTSLAGNAVSITATLITSAPVRVQTQSAGPLKSADGDILTLSFENEKMEGSTIQSLTYIIYGQLSWMTNNAPGPGVAV